MRIVGFPGKCICVFCAGVVGTLPFMTEVTEKECIETWSICRNPPVALPDESEQDHSPGPLVGFLFGSSVVTTAPPVNFERSLTRDGRPVSVSFREFKVG
jgi:hypothetical protein